MRVLRGGVVALAVVAALVPMPEALIERWYSNTLYPPMQRLLTAITNLLPIAFFDNRYVLDTSIMILTYVMLGWGLNIVVGLAGLLDLGYVAFYAVGAYS